MESYKLFENDLHTVLISFLPLYFQPLTQEDDKITFKCHHLSSRADTEADVHLQLSSLPPLLHFCPHCY